ncbi:MAG: hypothetical protein KDK97_04765 [Verrucomicrobiales bacterium]|nr:hypothetical protein [Verrucomicrobiales bacterium]MCP5559142.1 hypothetical protein [Verrucomicrobiaceae bacterium]
MNLRLIAFQAASAIALVTQATSAEFVPPYNDLVLNAIQTMPGGGGYTTTPAADAGLERAVSLGWFGLRIAPHRAQPSYCSGATYQVFISALQAACERSQIRMPRAVQRSLVMERQPDGVGVWGRWNANGPGTARLFHETGLGVNFEDWSLARPGDFLKIFWNEHIGKRERGHSVVFLAREKDRTGAWQVRIWSSNQPDGYGAKTVPQSDIKRAIFSRLTHPSACTNLPGLGVETYLADMLRRDGSIAELRALTGLSR